MQVVFLFCSDTTPRRTPDVLGVNWIPFFFPSTEKKAALHEWYSLLVPMFFDCICGVYDCAVHVKELALKSDLGVTPACRVL